MVGAVALVYYHNRDVADYCNGLLSWLCSHRKYTRCGYQLWAYCCREFHCVDMASGHLVSMVF
jgi:hypothetical protein